MDDLSWQKLCTQFPQVPADFRVERMQQQAKPGRPLQGGNRPVISLAFSPDATMLAASGGGLIPGPADIRVFNVASRELRKVCHYHCMGVFNLTFDPSTALLASTSHDYSVVLWELDRNDAIFLVGGPDCGISRTAAEFVGSQVVVADGMTFADSRAALATFDLATGKIQTLFELDGDLGISKLVVLPEHELLVAAIDSQRSTGCLEMRCVTIDGTERARYPLEMSLYDLAAADSGTLVSTGTFDGETTEILAFEAVSGRLKARRPLGPQIGAYVATSPARDHFAVAYDRGVEVCSLMSLRPELRLKLGDERPCSVTWSPDGAWIAVGTHERTVRLFDAANGVEHLA
jgi:WD40 repeat protein